MMLSSKNILMADFPPNLEDGELWLPSDIIHEITYSTDHPPQKNLSFSPPPPPLATLSPHLPSKDFVVHYGFMGANPSENYVTSTHGSFYSDHHSGCAAPYGGFQRTPPPPISLYCIPVKQHLTQIGWEEKGGTGVFIPRAVFAKREKMSNCGGVGVLFNNQKKNKKGAKTEEAFKCSNEKKSTKKEGGLKKNDKSRSQHPIKKILP